MSKSVYFFIVLFCLPLFAQDVNLEAEKEAIKEVCRKETMSFMNRDGFTQRSCMTDEHDFVRIVYDEENAHGYSWHRKLDPNKKDESTEKQEPYPVKIENDDYIFHINGDLAWVSYRQKALEEALGRTITWEMRENRTFRKENGEWKIVAAATLSTGCDDPKVFHIKQKLTDISNLLIDAKEFDKAIRVAELAVEMFPESSHAYDALAWAYYNQGNKEKTIEYAQKALDQIPKDNFTPQWRQAQIKQWAEGKFEAVKQMK